MAAWFNEVIWYWIFVIALLFTLGNWSRISGHLLILGLSVAVFFGIILLFAGVQPRVIG